MIIELSFVLVGGTNFALERKWGLIEKLMSEYPQATWRKIVDWKKGKGKYVVEIK